MYHIFIDKDIDESYILSDISREDIETLKGLVTSEKNLVRIRKTFETYDEAERRAKKILSKSKPQTDNTLEMSSKSREDMLGYYSRASKKHAMSVLPYIANQFKLAYYYNTEFRYYVFYYICECTDHVTIDYILKFSDPMQEIQLEIYAMMHFADRYKESTLLSPYLATTLPFEKDWVSEWVKNAVEVENLELWRRAQSLFNRKECKVVCYAPLPSSTLEHYRECIDYEVFKDEALNKRLRVYNPEHYAKMLNLYKTSNIDDEKIIIRKGIHTVL